MAVMQELQRQWPHRQLRAVAVTADAYEVTRDSCISAGFNGWLPKPFHIVSSMGTYLGNCGLGRVVAFQR